MGEHFYFTFIFLILIIIIGGLLATAKLIEARAIRAYYPAKDTSSRLIKRLLISRAALKQN